MKRGRRHLWLGLRVLFNYLEATGYDGNFLNALRKALPKVTCGIDLKVPSEEKIIESSARLSKAMHKYQAFWTLLLDSGLRGTEAVQVINEFKPENAERVGEFYRVEIGSFRGTKQAYFGYMTEATFKLLSEGTEQLEVLAAYHYLAKMRFIQAKYLRKFAFDKMIELEVPESVADFIEGRVATKIGARHYCVLRRQADKFYLKYARYLAKLRAK